MSSEALKLKDSCDDVWKRFQIMTEGNLEFEENLWGDYF